MSRGVCRYGRAVQPFAVAHRTPASAAACVRLAAAGATVFELDVQLRGEAIVVSHYLPAPGLGRWFEHDNGRPRRARAVRVDALLLERVRDIPPGCTLLIDPKDRDPGTRLALAERLVAELPAGRSLVVSCADPVVLDRLRGEGVRTWRTVGNRDQLYQVLAGAALQDEAVTVRHRLLNPSTVAALRARVPCVVAWTVNSVIRARRLREWGVHGITTDRVRVLSICR